MLLGAGVSFLNAEIFEENDTDTAIGFSVDLLKNVFSATNVDFGVLGDFGWHRKNRDFDGFDITFNAVHFAGGVRVTASQMDRVAPFGQFLVGGVRSSFGGDIDCDDIDELCTTDPMIAVGGGIDVRLSDRANFRGQIDYFRVFTEDEGTNAIRFVIGVSTRFGGR